MQQFSATVYGDISFDFWFRYGNMVGIKECINRPNMKSSKDAYLCSAVSLVANLITQLLNTSY